MPVLDTSKFDDDSIKNERASTETAFSHYKSMGNFLDAQGQLTPSSVVRSGQNSNSSEILCMSLLPASIKRIGSKATEKRWRHRFPIISQWGLSVAMVTRVMIQSAPKHSAAFPPPQWCFTQNLFKIGQLASEIFKFESVDDGRRWTTTAADHWYTISSPCEPSAQVS